jgi:hypothetical protein
MMTGLLAGIALLAQGQTAPKVADLPSRAGVTQRILVLTPAAPKAVVVLLAGGHGGLQIAPDGAFKWGAGNFLIRSRQLFVDQGLMVAVVDAPSDRQGPPFLNGFRQTPEHVQDLKAVIGWLREQTKLPVWLVGTSRGTQSAAYAATQLQGADGPDGIVLTSTILTDRSSRPVPAMELTSLHIPVLVVHHEQDGCALCRFSDTAGLMEKLVTAPRQQLLTFKGGNDKGDPCDAFAHHGFNGLESDVVSQTAAWVLAK